MKITYEKWKNNIENGIVDIISDKTYEKYMQMYENENIVKEKIEDIVEDTIEYQNENNVEDIVENLNLLHFCFSIYFSFIVFILYNKENIKDVIINFFGI